MTDQKVELTEEQQIDQASGNAASARFLRRHPEYKQTENNTTLMVSAVKALGRWTIENLEKAFEENRDKLELDELEVGPAVTTPLPEEKIPEFPWGVLTKSSIAAIPQPTFRKWFSRKDGEFERQVNRVLQGRDQFTGEVR
jgi:hypothetical protein